MQVIKAIPCGYCKGVINAINIAKNTRINYPNEKITVLGMLVHNKYVSLALDKLNIKSIDEKNEEIQDYSDSIINRLYNNDADVDGVFEFRARIEDPTDTYSSVIWTIKD